MADEAAPSAAATPGPTSLLFDAFELRLDSGELFAHGVPVKLQPRPAKVLEILARHAGQVVSREEVGRQVWGEDTFVELEESLNFAILQIRRALGDSASAPRFVETVPRRGYRFLAPVESVAYRGEPVELGAAPAPPSATEPAEPPPGVARRPAGLARLAAMLVLALSAMGHRPPSLGPLGSGEPIRLAVLPFESLGTVEVAEAGQPVAGEALAEGLTEEVIAELVRLAPDRLSVIGSTSAMAYKGSEKTPRQIGRELAVGHLLLGSVRQQGEAVRIATQLVRAADGTLVWAEHFEGELGSSLARQTAVGAAGALGVAVDRTPPKPPGVPPAAYEAYLDALHLARQRPTGLARAREALASAVTLAPGFAAAHAALAEIQVPVASEALARRAVELDPDLALGHRALAQARLYLFDWEEAGREFELALRLDPGAAETHHQYAEYLASLGRFDEAIATAERAWSLDPLSEPIGSDLAWYYYIARRDDEAVHQARRTLQLNPDHDWAQHVLLFIAMRRGDDEGGLAAARELVRIKLARGLTAPTPVLSSARDYWDWLQLGIDSAPDRFPTDFIASVALGRGEHDRALAALEQAACRERTGWLLLYLAVEPRYDLLRLDPRFERAMDCVGIPAEARQAGRRAALMAASRRAPAAAPGR